MAAIPNLQEWAQLMGYYDPGNPIPLDRLMSQRGPEYQEWVTQFQPPDVGNLAPIPGQFAPIFNPNDVSGNAFMNNYNPADAAAHGFQTTNIGGTDYADRQQMADYAQTQRGGFWEGIGPFALALLASGAVAAGPGIAGAAGAGSAAPVAGAVPESVGGIASSVAGGFDPYALTGPLTTGVEGGLAGAPAYDAGMLTGPMTTGAAGAGVAGIPFQQGYNLLDPSTYGGSSAGGGLPSIPGMPGGINPASAIPGALNAASGAGAGTAAGAGGNSLGSLAGIGTGLYDLLFGGQKVDPSKLNTLWQAGLDTYNTARDPQQALYGRTVQQLQDQTRAGQSARGTAMSPFGAAGEADVMKNFNIDWNNNMLQRQLGGLQGLSEATGGYYRQANQDRARRDASLQSGTNALLTGINQGMNPGGWLNSLWNSGGSATGGMADPSMNYWGGGNVGGAAGPVNPNYNLMDPSTYFGMA